MKDEVLQDDYVDTGSGQSYSLTIVGRLCSERLRVKLLRDSHDEQGNFVVETWSHIPHQWNEVVRRPARALADLPSPYGGERFREEREHALRMVAVGMVGEALALLNRVRDAERINDFCFGGAS